MVISMRQVLALQPVYDLIKKKTLPIKTAYKLSRLFKVIDNEARFYTEQLNTIIEQYALRDENGDKVTTNEGNSIQIAPDYVELTSQKINELLSLDVELPDLLFSLDELDSLGLTMEEVNAFFKSGGKKSNFTERRKGK